MSMVKFEVPVHDGVGLGKPPPIKGHKAVSVRPEHVIMVVDSQNAAYSKLTLTTGESVTVLGGHDAVVAKLEAA